MSSKSRASSQTRQALLDAGREILLNDEPAGFSVGAVARGAGISRQAAYLHFDSRAAILLAVVAHANARAGLARRVARIDSAPDGLAALGAFVSTVVWQASRLGPALHAVREMRRTDQVLDAALGQRPDGRRQIATSVVQRLSAEALVVEGLTPARACDLLLALTGLEPCEGLLSAGWSERRVVLELRRVVLAAVVRHRA